MQTKTRAATREELRRHKRRKTLHLMVREMDERDAEDGVVAQTPEELRLMMSRRLHLLADRWRGCPERLCKRHRLCLTPRITRCSNAPLPEPLTERARVHLNVAFHKHRAAAARAEQVKTK